MFNLVSGLAIFLFIIQSVIYFSWDKQHTYNNHIPSSKATLRSRQFFESSSNVVIIQVLNNVDW